MMKPLVLKCLNDQQRCCDHELYVMKVNRKPVVYSCNKCDGAWDLEGQPIIRIDQ